MEKHNSDLELETQEYEDSFKIDQLLLEYNTILTHFSLQDSITANRIEEEITNLTSDDFNVVLSSFPIDSLKKLGELRLKIEYLEGLTTKYESGKKDNGFVFDFLSRALTLLWFFGVLVMTFGFNEWYSKQQVFRNKELKLKEAQLPKVFATCQSCGEIISRGEERPLNKDHSINLKYCSMCFINGEFSNPTITIEEMKGLVKSKMRVKTRFTNWVRLLHMKKLQRWKTR